MRRLLLIVGVAAASSALTAAAIALPAGADEGDGDTREAFRACMEAHGIRVPDGDRLEVLVTPDGVTVNGEPVDRDAFREARRACGGPFRLRGGGLPGLRGDATVPQELRERLERLHDCIEQAREAVAHL